MKRSPPSSSEERATVVFDGNCGLCSGAVDFITHRDARRVFSFVAAQSPAGAAIFARHGLDGDTLDALALEADGRLYTASTAALTIAHRLGLPWALLFSLVLVPRPARDWVYRQVAGNRYRLSGRRDCRAPVFSTDLPVHGNPRLPLE